MNEHYAQGFIQKCAEEGVDPEQLVKTAVRGDQLARLIDLAIKSKGNVLVPKRIKGPDLLKGWEMPGYERASGLVEALRSSLGQLPDFDLANAATRRVYSRKGVRDIPALEKLFRSRRLLREFAPMTEQAQAVRDRLGARLVPGAGSFFSV
jgi:hypothetical protein